MTLWTVKDKNKGSGETIGSDAISALVRETENSAINDVAADGRTELLERTV